MHTKDQNDQNTNQPQDQAQVSPPPAQSPDDQQNQPTQDQPSLNNAQPPKQEGGETQDQQAADYVNSYTPPSTDQPPQQSDQQPQSADSTQNQPQTADSTQNQPQTADSAQPSGSNSENTSEELADQNIFFLLGVHDGTFEEKESFLNEMQQVVWEDFLENDLKFLVRSEEKERIDQILADTELSDLDKQEKILEYLESLMPVADLEQIMIEKALELKQDMVEERVEGMREFHAGQEENIAKIEQAAQQFAQGKWYSGAVLLNELLK